MTVNTAQKSSSSSPDSSSAARPFLKWAGGKSQLLDELVSRIPPTFERYYEPFLGGAALFFALTPQKAELSDSNRELINVYQVIQSRVEELIEDLKKHRYEKSYYYQIRELDRSAAFSELSDVERASRFIFLNKTCFNGLYRVNSSGQYNVPFGRYSNPRILDAENLRACHQALQRTTLRSDCFETIEERATAADFVYFDPPYAPLSETASVYELHPGRLWRGYADSARRSL